MAYLPAGTFLTSILATSPNITGVEECAVTQMSGTSMSSPVVAGAASLVRQYFMDGFYPSGRANRTDRFSPSGMLVKAVLLGSAATLNGTALNTNQELGSAPSGMQGYGRLDLSRALPLGNGTLRMQVGGG